MSKMFCERGTVYVVKGSAGQGLYSVPGLTGSYTLVNGMDVEEMDSFSTVATLDDQQIMYVFGKDTGNVKISGIILLGPAGANKGTGDVKSLASWFSKVRVSKSNQALSVSIAGAGAMKVYIVGLVLGVPDAELNIMPFAVIGKTINSGLSK